MNLYKNEMNEYKWNIYMNENMNIKWIKQNFFSLLSPGRSFLKYRLTSWIEIVSYISSYKTWISYISSYYESFYKMNEN